MKLVNVVCDGATRRGFSKDDGSIELTIESRRSNGTNNICVPSLPDKLKGEVHPAAIDLVRIAAFSYWADQMVDRPVDVDVAGDMWPRKFVMRVPVDDPQLWSSADVSEALTAALNYGTGDTWSFRFTQLQQDAQERQAYLFAVDPLAVGGVDQISLFSGGADSLCAAIDQSAMGREPLLVSHAPLPRTQHRQTTLQRALAQSALRWHFPSVAVQITKRGTSEKERTQRTRGFLYSAIGAATAASFGLEDVVLADNGFVSVNLPLNGQTIDTKMSRTTHPKFQWHMNKLLRLVVPGVTIRNPLLFRTRSEVLDILKAANLQALLRESNSCAAGGRLPEATPHCGTCSQCVDRLIGVMAAGLAAFDSPYKTDIATAELSGFPLMMVESYIRLMRRLRHLPIEQLVETYPEVIDCAISLSPDEFPQLLDMLVRQADQAHEAFVTIGKTHAEAHMAGELPGTCLISLAATGKPQSRPPKWRPPVLRVVELTPAEAAEFSAARFNSRLPVTISGERSKLASNRIEIDGKRLDLPDADFILLLRLILELGRTTDGYATKGGGRKPGGLADEPGIVPASIEQAISRLRRLLAPIVSDAGDRGFIETNSGRIRVSTHLRYIDCNVVALKEHPNDVIRHLAAELMMTGAFPVA